MVGTRTKKKGPRPTLSLKQADALCRAFVPIGDRIFEYMASLEREGFSTFVPGYTFLRSFCESKADVEIHRRCTVEKAKNLLGRPWPLPAQGCEDVALYESDYLKRLSDARDKENGAVLSELPTRFPDEIWRIEIDPCQKRRAYASIKERELYEQRVQFVLDEQKCRFELEVARHATQLATKHVFNTRGRYDFFSACMERDAGPLEFVYDRSKSRANFPIFSKQMTDDWDLCWAIEDPRTFFWSPLEGDFSPSLQLRSRQFAGSIDEARLGEILIIRYALVVPGFTTAYRRFFDLRELETLIKAHLCLYGLMASIIEGAISKYLGRAP